MRLLKFVVIAFMLSTASYELNASATIDLNQGTSQEQQVTQGQEGTAPAPALSQPEAGSPTDSGYNVGESHNIPIVDLLLNMTAFGSEWVLWLLIFLSVASVAIIMERALYFFRIRVDFDHFLGELMNRLKDGNKEQALQFCQSKACLEGKLAEEALKSEAEGVAAIDKGMASVVAREQTKMDKGLTFLGTLGNNAPFIGLFGTVLGIIQAFEDLSENPAGGPAVVMAGISEALVATAVGLFVAIPAVIAFNWFQRLIAERLSQADALQNIILKHYTGDQS